MGHISPILPPPLQCAMYDDSIYTQIETAKPFSGSIPNVHSMNSSIPELIRCKFDADLLTTLTNFYIFCNFFLFAKLITI